MSLIECRICENCGESNEPRLLECKKCGFDLSFSPITTINDIPSQPQPLSLGKTSGWKLIATDNCDIELVIADRVMVGRDEPILNGYLQKSTFVSREHATLYLSENKLYIIDASTNGTYINGVKIKKLMATEISVGDEITFADLKFRVSYAD